MKNNIPLGILGGALAAFIGGGIWAAVTLATHYQIGWMAVGVGILVGFAVRLFGKGTYSVFSVIGAVFALIGCVLGNFFTGIGFVSNELQLTFWEVLTQFDYSATVSLLTETFSPMDILFYGIAVWEGYKFAVVPEETASLAGTGMDGAV